MASCQLHDPLHSPTNSLLLPLLPLSTLDTLSPLSHLSPPSITSLPHPPRHAQVLGSIQAFTHWLSELYLTSERSNGQFTDSIVWFVSLVVDSTYPLITRDIPEKVILSACQLLLSLATTVRPKFCLSLPGVKALIKKARDGELTDIPHRVIAAALFVYCVIYNHVSACLEKKREGGRKGREGRGERYKFFHA